MRVSKNTLLKVCKVMSVSSLLYETETSIMKEKDKSKLLAREI
jgi:hypothetical protein